VKTIKRLTAILALAGLSTMAVAYPDRPVEIVVGYPAGGGTDNLARLFANKLATKMDGKFIVVNKPGAVGKIALNYVVNSKPDGHTVLLDAGMSTSRSVLEPQYKVTAQHFEPVTLVSRLTYALIANAGLGINSFNDLAQEAKRGQRDFFYASLGPGSSHNLLGELFRKRSGMSLREVPYQGGAQAVNDLVAGHVQLMFSNFAPFVEQAKAGRIKVLAVTGEERAQEFPDVPTMRELGYQDIVHSFWYGFLAPKGVSPEVVEKLNAAILEITAEPAFQAQTAALGIPMTTMGTSEFRSMLANDANRWRWLAKEVDYVPPK
jgi:tripartite-type tricarboxylate transporter receptor subunit TctC